MNRFLFFCVLVITFASCTQLSSEYKRTKQENDSLKLHILKNEAEMNELLSTLNVIEEEIQSIRLTEELFSLQKDAELSDSRKEQLKKNMTAINETLKKNRQRLSELQDKLNKSGVNFSALQKTIDRLTKEMDAKGELIIVLRSEIDRKEVQIEELSLQIDELHEEVKTLENINSEITELISEQEQELNTVYYCFGTIKELKEQSILTGGGIFSKSKALQSDFNHEYFLAVDKRTLTSLQLYSSKATIKTNHPAGTYKLIKDANGKLTLQILHTTVFWSLSNFLVIEIK